jgi:hypothetical protein
MQVDAELTGVLIALGFVVMGFVSGFCWERSCSAVAVLLRVTRKSN